MLKLMCVVLSLVASSIPTMNGNGRLRQQDVSSSKIVLGSQRIKSLSLGVENGVTESESTVFSVSVKFEYPDFEFSDGDEYATAKEIKEAKIAQGKDYYSSHNSELIEDIDTSEMKNLYVSTYAPFFSFEIDSDCFQEQYENLEYIASSESVEIIYVDETERNEESVDNAKITTGAKNLIYNYIASGKGVTIGLLELGIVDKNLSCFKYTDLTIRDEWYFIETVSQHANDMASIITGNYGIAPVSKLLSVQLSGEPSSEIDWMLDRGVDVINCSFGNSENKGKYNSTSAYMDYIVYTYGVVIVAAAGNNGKTDDLVENPGLGYNVITIGSNTGQYDESASLFSSCVTIDGPSKPDIMVPGENIFVEGTNRTISGTSPATAIATGCIALLLEMRPEYIGYPQLVKAVLCAGARSKFEYFFDNIEETRGFGPMNVENAYNANSKLVSLSASGNSTSFNGLLQKGSVIRGVICWLAKADGNVNNTIFHKVELDFVSEYGGTIKKFYDETRNDGLIEYRIPSTENYYIRPVCKEYKNYDAKIGIAYYIYTLDNN